jgi:hypothetical protein
MVCAKDWSATPLEPLESRSQSIRMAVSRCRNSRFPILIEVPDLPDRVGALETSLWRDLVEAAFVLPLAAPSQPAPADFLIPGSIRAASWTRVIAASATWSRSAG